MKQQHVKKLRPSGVPRPVRSSRTADCLDDQSRRVVGINEFERTQKSSKKSKKKSDLKARSHTLQFGNVNVTTCKDEAKLVQTVIGVKDLGHLLTAVTETHKTGHGVIEDWPEKAGLEGWRFYYSGFDREARAGVGLVCSPECEVEEWEVVEKARIMYVRMKCKGIRMQCWITYAPTNMKNDEIKSDFYTKLNRSVNKFKKEYPKWPKIVVGDLNSTIGFDAPNSEFLGPSVDSYQTTDNGLRMVEFCQEHDLYALNTMFECKASHRITFKLGKIAKRVDYILTDKWFKFNCTNSRAYPFYSAIFETNHMLTMTTFRLPVKKYRKRFFKKKKAKPRLQITALRDDEELRKIYGLELEESLPDLNAVLEGGVSVDVIEQIMRDTVNTVTMKVVPVKDPDRKEWMDDEYSEMLKQYKTMKKVEKKYKFSKKIRKKRTTLKNQFYGAMADDINQARVMRQVEEEYRLAKGRSMLKKSTKIKCPPEKLHSKFSEHFKDRPLPKTSTTYLPKYIKLEDIIPVTDIDIDIETPGIDEVAYQMEKKLKNGRCTGTDGLVGEQLKYGWESDKLADYIHEIVRRIWEDLEMPENWSKLRLKPIFKNKGSKMDPAMYRGMMTSATSSKVLVQIILDRVREHYENSILPSQYGFRRNKSTKDAIFIARQVIKKFQGEIFGCFVDLTAAYDHLPRPMLWQVLRLRFGDKNEKIVKILEKLYENTSAKLDGVEELIAVEMGLRQGGQESCCVFNYYLDTVLRVVLYKIKLAFKYKIEPGIQHNFEISNECTNRKQRAETAQNGHESTIFTNFADDLFVTCKSEEELAEVMKILVETFIEFGLTMSESKTKTMSFNTDEDTKNSKTILKINGFELENVHLFRYLGHVLSDDPKEPKYLKQQIGSAYGKWNEFKAVFKDKRINLKTRIMIAESMVRSRLVYAVETERLSVKQREKLDTIWVRMLRQMVSGGFARDHNFIPKYSNENIYKICETKPASEFCQIQHLKFLAHVARMPNSAPQKQWLFTELPGSKDQWLPLARDLKLDPIQLRYTIFDKNKLNELLA